jgi:LysR family cyn operon transcriptional activator
MELRKLKSFLAVAKELHFGRAAEKLNITQPALTYQIKQLESELGFDLFDKSKRVNNRKVELTEAGTYLSKELSRVIDLLDRVLKNAKINSEKSKQLKLGIPKICMTYEVVQLIKKLQLLFPDTNFKIIECTSSISVQEAIFKGNLDIGITTFPLVFKGIEYKFFKKEFLNVLLPINHPLAKYQKIKIEQLRNDKWIELDRDLSASILEDVEIYCKNVGFSRYSNIIQEVSNVELLLGLVNAGIGIAVFSSELPLHSEGVVSKKLIFPDNTQLEVIKVLAFNESLDKKHQEIININW